MSSNKTDKSLRATPKTVWPIDVRWADMDSYGHVNNAKYFTYCESARMHYFECVGLYEFCGEDHDHDHEQGPALVTATCNFRQQVRYPAKLEVGVWSGHVGRSSFNLDYELVHAETGEVVADGTSVVVWVDYAAGKSTPMPEALRQRIRDYEGL